VIFAQMVDDPSSHPELFPTDGAQENERARLFRILEDLVQWENTTNETVLKQAREEIWRSWRFTCHDNKDHPQAKELFNPNKLPAFFDPFAGGGSLPLEAQRLGFESYASDLNPVAVLINKAMIEIPPKFAGKPPVNPESRKDKNLFRREWRGAQGLAEDVQYYGRWMRDEAEKRIGYLYPKIEVTADMAKTRPDLRPLVGNKLTVIAWIWVRTVKSPNPAFAQIDVPLASTFMLGTKPGKEAYVEPVIHEHDYHFIVKTGKPNDTEAAKNGTKLARGANFKCLMSDTPIEADYIKAEGTAGRMGSRLMAIAAEGERGRVYLSPTNLDEMIAERADPGESAMAVHAPIAYEPRALWCLLYGLNYFDKLFTARQLVALTTFSDLVQEALDRAKVDAEAAGLPDDKKSLGVSGAGATAYADSIASYLGCAVSRMANYSSTLCAWSSHAKDELAKQVFLRQGLPMTWDFAETNPFSSAGGTLDVNIQYLRKAIEGLPGLGGGAARQADAMQAEVLSRVVSTDPPYFDNIGYADLSDFFYVWLRRSLKPTFPELFATLTVPKTEELIAAPYRQGGREKAEAFFLEGMTKAMRQLAAGAHSAFPITIYYAFKQSESDRDKGTASTGWDTFLASVIRAGLAITGTWPMRTELIGNLKKEISALASSIVLVCRPQAANPPTTTRREFIAALKTELPEALKHLQRGNIAPVDLAQAAIGPGMAVYTRYANVLDASGKALSVREALAIVNQMLDEVLAEQEGDFDADTRWALAWFDQTGFGEGEYGVAETLSKAKNTSVAGMVEANILKSKGGRVRLLRPEELPNNWDPLRDSRLSVWETVHHFIKALNEGGEDAAAELVSKLGNQADVARELAYRLYIVCERKKRPQEALAYNGLVQSWPEIVRLAREGGAPRRRQTGLFEKSED
jgi:putative DNA methylase